MGYTGTCEITLRRNRFRELLITAVVWAGAAGGLRADNWPQWLGPQRDGVWRETGILDKFPKDGPKVLWKVPIGGGYTGPAVVGDRVFVMDRQLPADSVVIAGTVEPDTALFDALVAAMPGAEVHAAGDCSGLGLIRKATEEGARAACAI